MAVRGRPPIPGGAMTPAQRKRIQRERDRTVLLTPGASFDELTTAALVENLSSLIADERPGLLGDVLKELGRRGGVNVTARPAALAPGKRIKK